MAPRRVTYLVGLPAQRIGSVALRVAFGALVVVVSLEALLYSVIPDIGDHTTYISAAQRWLAGGSFYPTYQLEGPYLVAGTEVLYPPVVVPFLVAFSFLPAVIWWAVPMALLGYVLVYWRPSPIGWLLIFACLANPLTFTIYVWGNPGMWVVAFLALGTIYHWPSALVLLKPTLAPFALVGIHHRSWWITLAVLALVSLTVLPLWEDYLTVLENAYGPRVGLQYSLGSVPLMLVPLIARWFTSRT